MTEGTQVWDIVAGAVEAYLADLQGGQTDSCIEDHIPEHPKEWRSLALVELAKVEMEHLALNGSVQSVQDYLARFPELRECTGGAPFDLIVNEVRLLLQRGDCDPAVFYQAYPQHADRLKKLFTLSESISTAMPANIAQAPPILHPGQTIDDFELIKLLGSGAFAQVFLARQSTMHRLVALKVSADRGDEPKTLAQLDHPHIVRVFDVRRLPDRRLRLLSMQYAPGGTLQNVMAELKLRSRRELTGRHLLEVVDQALVDAGLPPPEESSRRAKLAGQSYDQAVGEIGIQLASALDYAHGLRVLHRDIKPANVLLTAEANCKLADFNVSFSEAIGGSNASSYFGGSLIYMSPEQLLATRLDSEFKPSDLDGRSDVFSLSFLIWELLTLQKPWPNDQAYVDWDATIESVRESRKLHPPQLPTDFEATPMSNRILRALSKGLAFDRSQRMETAGELAGQLRLCMIPRAYRLLHPEERSWGSLCGKWPIWMAALIVFLPNGLAGAFNYHYNLAWLTARHPESHSVFVWVSVLMNFIAFSMGGLFFLWIVGPIAGEVARRFRIPESSPSPVLHRAVLIGHTVACFGLSLWLIAGLLFPWLLSMKIDSFDRSDAVHFFLSLAICGAIAIAYPFLGMSMVAMECWYGPLVGRRLLDDRLSDHSISLMRWCDFYLLAAAGVPLLGIGLLLAQAAPVRPALMALVVAGGLGLLFAMQIHRRIRQTLEVLKQVCIGSAVPSND